MIFRRRSEWQDKKKRLFLKGGLDFQISTHSHNLLTQAIDKMAKFNDSYKSYCSKPREYWINWYNQPTVSNAVTAIKIARLFARDTTIDSISVLDAYLDPNRHLFKTR